MRRIKAGGFAEILEIGKEDILFKYQEQLVGLKIRLTWLLPRASPWFSATGVLVLRDICLNGIKIRKGDHLWFSKVKLRPISRI